ncbi:unnamed protein product [Diatraea saccharalis]|uniref:B box-type domain-containing protein n=1 Tax=Diatraea saccharalis TaxID=40085 RepID=A0A9N9RFP3_9NEOP|nr:unnamed protein product [Diatraea saccharalis]
MECPTHGDPLKLFCKGCNDYICHKCTLWNHRDHDHSPIKGDFDKCRIEVMKILEDTRIGKKVIKASIDRAVAMLKAYEKDATEANMKIRNTMRYYTEFIEARKKYLIDKVEKMRQAKTTQLSDYTNTLRGMLAALAHTNDFLVQNMDSDGLRLFMANEKGRSQIDYFSTMFKKMTIDEERIVFISPYFDLVDLLRKFDVQRICAISGQVVNSVIQYPREAMIPLQSLQTAQPHRPLNYSLASTSSTTSPPSQTLCLKSYYCNNTSALNMELTTPTRGIGQAISGYWMPVSSKPIRNFVPGEPMFSFGREGQGQGQVSRPWGLCIDREGHIIVADRRNNRIQIFTKDGEFKTMFGSKGNGPGQFDLPAGIATDIFGRIIVVDKDNHRIQIFSMSGNFIFAFGSFGKEYGQFQYPWDVAVNTLGNIVVTDTRNHRIQLFTREGAYMNKYVFEGANSMKMLKGPTTPRGVCFTTSGNIIVSDFENHRLLLVDSTLSKVLQCVGCEGSGIGEFNRPSGIVTDDEGRVIVADSKNQRIVVLTSDLRILSTVYFKSPDLDDKDRPCDVALTPEGYMVVMFETLPDTARDVASNDKEYIKIY